MLMTIEEASHIWCPQVRMFQNNLTTSHAYNRAIQTKDGKATEYMYVPPGCKCIGDRCAAWRWKLDPVPREIDLVTEDVEPRRGYCGLAGPLCS